MHVCLCVCVCMGGREKEGEGEYICIIIKPIVRKTALLIENTQLSLLRLTDGEQTKSISDIYFQDTAATERGMRQHKKAMEKNTCKGEEGTALPHNRVDKEERRKFFLKAVLCKHRLNLLSKERKVY